ncbi:MAG: 30S ribosomal protein S2 [Deltaproteobacteria bacterium]|nr:30S ribosomal protein S2 [Deltaproteobacteria bacterium]MBW2393100.1 30S ribosomal protein S2 [Deltaproteobacteria bacterium]
MSETPTDPSVQAPAATPAAATEPSTEALTHAEEREKRTATIRSFLEAGAHFGHQTRRWNPKMKPFIFGERNGVHIINLDESVPFMVDALEFLRETVAQGGKVLLVGTKRQAGEPIKAAAIRSQQYYVNNRWLGGMLTNFRTVKKSIEYFKDQLEILADEEQVAELAKKELSRLNRSVTKYRKSLDGIREMTRLPDAMFIIDVNKEHIAISEARRLGIPIIAIVDTNCDPKGIDFVVPGNDDAVRAIELYCDLVADACLEGAELFNQRIIQDEPAQGDAGADSAPGRRVVEIKQQQPGRRGRQAGGSHSAMGRPRRDERPAEGAPAPAEAAPAAETPAAAPEAPAAEAPAAAATDEAPKGDA